MKFDIIFCDPPYKNTNIENLTSSQSGTMNNRQQMPMNNMPQIPMNNMQQINSKNNIVNSIETLENTKPSLTIQGQFLFQDL